MKVLTCSMAFMTKESMTHPHCSPIILKIKNEHMHA